jgi:hypothetical protein
MDSAAVAFGLHLNDCLKQFDRFIVVFRLDSDRKQGLSAPQERVTDVQSLTSDPLDLDELDLLHDLLKSLSLREVITKIWKVNRLKLRNQVRLKHQAFDVEH